ncbi:unnamed protein product [Notodromas monacha]|uniref:Uncharacterized protein n=1 Tax=Notodromas monacha TaxID=399045 RepID=A0A7R9BCV8_9CRUS|nr:unnamed protein product [Notodromas monacha]CAG0912338.1 unnamed protein product [Notodromas monacha]
MRIGESVMRKFSKNYISSRCARSSFDLVCWGYETIFFAKIRTASDGKGSGRKLALSSSRGNFVPVWLWGDSWSGSGRERQSPAEAALQRVPEPRLIEQSVTLSSDSCALVDGFWIIVFPLKATVFTSTAYIAPGSCLYSLCLTLVFLFWESWIPSTSVMLKRINIAGVSVCDQGSGAWRKHVCANLFSVGTRTCSAVLRLLVRCDEESLEFLRDFKRTSPASCRCVSCCVFGLILPDIATRTVGSRGTSGDPILYARSKFSGGSDSLRGESRASYPADVKRIYNVFRSSRPSGPHREGPLACASYTRSAQNGASHEVVSSRKKLNLVFRESESLKRAVTTVSNGKWPETDGSPRGRAGSSVQFTEIRSAKRVERTEEGIATDSVQIVTVKDPRSGNLVSLFYLFSAGCQDIDPSSGDIFAPSLSSAEGPHRLSLVDKISEPIPAQREGTSLTRGTISSVGFIEFNTSPRNILLGESSKQTFDDAILLNRDNPVPIRAPVEMGFGRPGLFEPLTIQEAVAQGLLNKRSGLFRRGAKKLTLEQAFAQGLLIVKKQQSKPVTGLCLYDAVLEGLVDESSGQIRDPCSGEEQGIEEAAEAGILNADVSEVYHTAGGIHVSLREALRDGVIVAARGRCRFRDTLTGKLCTLREAVERKLIARPLTLKQCCDLGLVDDKGEFLHPLRTETIPLLEAVAIEYLELDLNSVVDTSSGTCINLIEALAAGVLKPDSKFIDIANGSSLSLPEAADKGWLKSVCRKLIFDIDGFKDTSSGDYVSFNVALQRGLLLPSSKELVDVRSESRLSLQEAVKQKLVQSQLLEVLEKRVGIMDSDARELSVLEAVFEKRIDPQSGQIIDPNSNSCIPLQQAVKMKFITQDGAELLESLRSIVVTSSTVSKIMRKPSLRKSLQINGSQKSMTYRTALSQALIDEANGTLIHEKLGVIPLETAVKEDFIHLEQWPVDLLSGNFSNSTDHFMKTMEISHAEDSFSQSSVSPLPVDLQVCPSDQVFLIPDEGFSLEEAISKKLLDPILGILHIANAIVTFQNCLRHGLIDPQSATVVDPASGRSMTLLKSLEKQKLSANGCYIVKGGQQVTLREAIKKEYITFSTSNAEEVNAAPSRKLEVQQNGASCNIAISSREDSSIMVPLKIDPSVDGATVILGDGIEFYPREAVIQFVNKNESVDLFTAVCAGRIEPRKVRVKDPHSGRDMPINEAVRKGIVNRKTGIYQDSSRNKIQFKDSVLLGIITVKGIDPNEIQVSNPVSEDFPEATKESIPTELEIVVLEPFNDREVLLEDSVAEGTIKLVEADFLKNYVSDLWAKKDKNQAVLRKLSDLIAHPSECNPRMSKSDLESAKLNVKPTFKIVPKCVEHLCAPRKRLKTNKSWKKVPWMSCTSREALKLGLIDTAVEDVLSQVHMLRGPGGERLNLGEAVKLGILNASGGIIQDPLNRGSICLSDAIEHGFVNPSSGELSFPVGHSLSIPEAASRGLFDYENQKIVHPFSGELLTIAEAIQCQILNPKSSVLDPMQGMHVTLIEAVMSGVIADATGQIVTQYGIVPLSNVLKFLHHSKIFTSVLPQFASVLPPLGMSLPVAIHRKFVDVENKLFKDPVSNKWFELRSDSDLPWILDYPACSPECISLWSSIEQQLIKPGSITIQGREAPFQVAAEKGILKMRLPKVEEPLSKEQDIVCSPLEILPILKPETENVSMNVKPITFPEAYRKSLLNLECGEFSSTDDGKTISIKDAITRKLLRADDGATEKALPTAKMTLSQAIISMEKTGFLMNVHTNQCSLSLEEALDQHVVDPEGTIYLVDDRKVTSVKKAIEDGIFDPVASKFPFLKKNLKEAIVEGHVAILGTNLQLGIRPMNESVASGEKLRSMPTHVTIKSYVKRERMDPVLRVTVEEGLNSGVLTMDSPVTFPETNELLALGSAIESGFIRSSAYLVISNGEALLDCEATEISYQLDEEYCVEHGIYDRNRGVFISPDDGAAVSFCDAVEIGLINGSRIVIKCKITDHQPMPLETAIQKKIIDAKTGEIIDASNGEVMKFYEAVEKGWIAVGEWETIVSTPWKTFIQIIQEGGYNRETGFIMNVEKNSEQTLAEAILDGTVKPTSVVVQDWESQHLIPLEDALNKKLLSLTDDRYYKGNEGIDLCQAVKLGLVTANRHPISLPAAFKLGLLKKSAWLVFDDVTGDFVSLLDGIQRGILDAEMSQCWNSEQEKFIPLEEAIAENIIRTEDALYLDTRNGRCISMTEALDQNFITSCQLSISLGNALSKSLYNPSTGQVLDPCSGRHFSMKDAVANKVIDVSFARICGPEPRNLTVFQDVLSSNMWDDEHGVLKLPQPMSLVEAADQGILVCDPFESPLQDFLRNDFYHWDGVRGWLINPQSLEKISLESALQEHMIDGSFMCMKDLESNQLIPLSEAIKEGMIDASLACVHVTGGEDVSFKEAFHKGIIVPLASSINLLEALEKDLISERTGEFLHPVLVEKMSLKDALDCGALNCKNILVKHPDGSGILSFVEAIEAGVINMDQSSFEGSSCAMSLKESLKQGFMLQVPGKISLIDAIKMSVFDRRSGKFLDTRSSVGKWITLKTALESRLIDADSAVVQRSGDIGCSLVSLTEAMEKGLLDGDSARILDQKNGSSLDLIQAFELHLLQDKPPPVSLQYMLSNGLYKFDPLVQVGKIIDPGVGQLLTIHTALRKGLLHPNVPCFLTSSGHVLSLIECCRQGIIDRQQGTFQYENETFPLDVAMKKKLLVDFNLPMTLYEVVRKGLYSSKNWKVMDPKTGTYITVIEAFKNGILCMDSLRVRHDATGKLMNIWEAAQEGKLLLEYGVYITVNQKKLTLDAAIRKGLILDTELPLTVEYAVRMGLFEESTGLFEDPNRGTKCCLKEALQKSLISSLCTVYVSPDGKEFKSLGAAVRDGTIDANSAQVFSPSDACKVSLKTAFDKKLLRSVRLPLGFREALDDDFINLTDLTFVDMRKRPAFHCSLDYALKNDLIHPDTAKFFNTSDEDSASLRDVLLSGAFSLEDRSYLDDISGTKKNLCILVNGGVVIFLQERLTLDFAIQKGYLNVTTGMLSVPPSKKKIRLKQSFGEGLLDRHSAVVKHTAMKKLLNLKESVDHNLINDSTNLILDSKTHQLLNVETAIKNRILIPSASAITLCEALEFNAWDPNTCVVKDVFGSEAKTLSQALSDGIVSSTADYIKIPITGSFLTTVEALKCGLLDGETGMFNAKGDNPLSLQDAYRSGFLVAAKDRLAMEERCKLCRDSIEKLLDWIGDVENKLASQDPVKEDSNKLRNQINNLKQIVDDIEAHGRSVYSTLDQIDLISVEGTEFLSSEEISNLKHYGEELKRRFSAANTQADLSLRKLQTGLEDLIKYHSEREVFINWLSGAQKTLDDKEKSLTDLNKARHQVETVKEFLGDVMAHQADLRFITMSAQKFLDESKEHLKLLNAFRSSLPQRFGHIESHESKIRQEVQEVSALFQDVLTRAKKLSDRFSSVSDRQRQYVEAMENARVWLRDMEPRASKVCSEPVAAELKSIQEQLDRAKELRNEILSQARLFDQSRQATKNLVDALEGNASAAELSRLSSAQQDLDGRYKVMDDAVKNLFQAIESALVQCQDIQDAIDSQVSWLNQLDNNLRATFKPVSLNRERLNEQLQEHNMLQADVEAHRPSIQSLTQSALQMIQTSYNPRLAKKLESKFREMTTRFEKTVEKVNTRTILLDEVSRNLDAYLSGANTFEEWFAEIEEILDSPDSNQLDVEALNARMMDVARSRDQKVHDFDVTLKVGRVLVNKKDITDATPIKEQMKSLEARWKQLAAVLEERLKLNKSRAEQRHAYDKLREQVLQWLSQMEKSVDSLQPVALEQDLLKKQLDALKPLVKEHTDYASTIDRVNELGSIYEATVRGETLDAAGRRRSSVSPTKRASLVSLGSSPSRKGSLDVRNQSTGKMSIFGTNRRISTDINLQLDETGLIQEQLGEINNRYSLIGMKLQDRQTSLEGMKDEVKRQLDALKNFLANMDRLERKVPRESFPQNREETDKLLRLVRRLKLPVLYRMITPEILTLILQSIQEDLYDQQPSLDSLKNKTADLVKKHGTVPGSVELQDRVKEANQRWNELQLTCKNRCEFLDGLKEFHDSCENFAGWLSAKDKMMSVLGPIAADPRVVNTQLQQVQVLRDEFNAQYTQLEQLNHLGSSILQKLDPNSSDARKVTEKLNHLNQKWDALLERLDERHAALGAAAGAAKDFNALLSRIQSSLEKVSDDFEDLGPIGGDFEGQLNKIEKLANDLDQQRPPLAEAASLGEHLSKVLADAASRNDIKNMLGQAERMHMQLQRKLDNRRAELELSLRDEREFSGTCEALLGWLNDMLDHVKDKLLVSADENLLREQVEAFEPLYKEIMSREHEVIMLTNKGQEIASKGSVRDSRGLQKSLDMVQRQWDKLKREAVSRHTRLQGCMEHCRRFVTSQSIFLPWMAKMEDKLDRIGPISFKKHEVERQLKEMQSFKNELSRHAQEYETNKSHGEALLAACDLDEEGVKDILKALLEQWDSLNNRIMDRLQTLEEIAQHLNIYNDRVKDLGHRMQRIEDKLASHDSLGDASKDPKLLDRMKTLINEARQLENPLNDVENLGDKLCHAAEMQGSDSQHIKEDIDGLRHRLINLCNGLEDRCQDLERASAAVSNVKDRVKSITMDLGNLEEELNAMKPVARDLNTLKKQRNEIESFQRKLDQKADILESTNQLCSDLDRDGYTIDAKVAREQLDGIQKQLSRVQDRANVRAEDVLSAHSRLEAFYDLHGGVMEDLGDLAREVSDFKPIGGDVETIRAQQKDFAKFTKAKMEPLAQQVDKCNRQGQGLIQSALPGVNTQSMEADLGQKYFNKMLMDQQHSLDSVAAQGQEVAANAEPSERKQIEDQVQDLMLRFDALQNAAKTRTEILETTMEVAKEFQNKLLPLNEFMEKAEKKINGMKIVPTDEDKIQRLIEQHEMLHDDILGMKPSFQDTTDVAQALMSLVGDEDAQHVADKVQRSTDRYAVLVEDSDNLGKLLHDSKTRLRQLVLSYEDLLAWLDEMERRLNCFKVLSVFTDKLIEQTAQLTQLTEEIVVNETRVDEVRDCGLELMKHISSEEALQLKDKLVSIKRKHEELMSKGSELHKHAEEALRLVKQFHAAHNRVTDWLVDAEERLSALDRDNVTELSFAAVENEIRLLERGIQDIRPLLEAVNLVGPQLCQLSPGEGAATIESLVTRDNRRYEAVCEQVQRRAERVQLSKQRSLEVVNDVDELLEWFREAEGQLQDAEPPSSDPETIREQLMEHRALSDDISSQKGRGREVLANAKKVLLREASKQEDTSLLRERMDDLKETMENVSRLAVDRLGVLEQAMQLAVHLYDAHGDLCAWLDEIEQATNMMDMPSLRAEQIMRQQEANASLMQAVSEHKPLVDKLNKTGSALKSLCGDEDAAKVHDILEVDNQRYGALKAILRDRQQALERAMQETSQFSDKLDGMLSALASTADQVNNAEPISAHPGKIQEQIAENTAILEDLGKRESAYEAVKKAADDVISKAGSTADPAVRDIKAKLVRLNSLWSHIQAAGNNRGKSLNDALALAEKFWDELQAIMRSLKDLERTLSSQEPPAVEPTAIERQKFALEDIKNEIEQTQPEVEECRKTGKKLMTVCGEPDKPEVKKHIEDLDSAWDNVTALYAKREQNLIDAMEKSMEFHDTLQNILDFLESAENKFEKMGALGADIDAVKEQIRQLKDFKSDVDPQMVKVEALNRQAQELTARTSPDQATRIKKPLAEVNRRWDTLLKGIVDRQRALEHALLRLGQFQHALEELLVWINRTESTLDSLQPVLGDPAVIEVELAKLKVLVNDIHAHQSSVDTLNDAGHQLIESDKNSQDATTTQRRLNELNQRWNGLQEKAENRQQELEDALKEAQAFNAEIQDLLMWMSDVDSALSSSKPVGGLPETAKEQLARFMEVFDELEKNRLKVDSVLQQGQGYLKRSTEGAASNLQHNLRTLKQRWDSVLNRANDKKIKLEIALKEATEFHDALQSFVDWLTKAEKLLGSLNPVSRVMDTILEQIEEHKSFQKDVGAHREVMLNLDKKGTHLKYFSQKQDVILIKNLLISVQHRWERVVSKSAERTRALDHGYKEAKEFHDSWMELCAWLDDAKSKLDEMTASLGNDPDKIKSLLNRHKDFQRQLGSKQPAYDTTMKAGRVLKDKAPKTDHTHLQDMMNELKNKWNAVCTNSVDRQRKLEEALLFSGQFKDAIGALLDWLKKAEKELSHESPVHGDLDTVMGLVEQHNTFRGELDKRAGQVSSVKTTAEELLKSASAEDAVTIKNQTKDLSTVWEKVVRLSDSKSSRLSDALKQAEELHKAVHMLLEWLSDAEMKLRFAGPLPDTEEETQMQLNDHHKFMRELEMKEIDKDRTLALAQEIYNKCHPDGMTVIKHWMNIIQTRWDEREQRLVDHLRQLKDLADLLEELMRYLNERERTLETLESEQLPDDLPAIEVLIKEHQQEFMEDMAKRQPDVDRVCKPKRPSTTVPPSLRDRRVSKASRQASREPETPSRESSPDRDFGSRRSSRSTPDRDRTPDKWPHIGPRFPLEPAGSPSPSPSRKGSKVTLAEPTIKNPRARELWEKWRTVWMMAWDRQRRLQDKYNYLQEVERLKNFSFEEWRKRFMKWLNHKKSRAMDLFRKMDKDNDGRVLKDPDFIDGIIKSKFPTSRLEMQAVADIIDRNNDGYIDHQEFMAALRPDWNLPLTEQEQIEDEVQRQVAQCTCRHKFRVHHVGEGKYRFGESQKLRLVRILRSTVMVRVGGGWVALDEFLVKNDPCRAKGRTNVELREQFNLPDGSAQSMTPFKEKRGMSTSGLPFTMSSTPSQSGQRPSLLTTGPITKVREKTSRSTPMGRTSFSAGTPDSQSDNEGPLTFLHPRKGSRGGALSGSRPSSRGPGTSGSRPPSRAGSDISLDSTDGSFSARKSATVRRTPSLTSKTVGGRSSTPTRSGSIPIRTGSTGNLSRKASTPLTSAAYRSPASPMISRSKIPVLTGVTPRPLQHASSVSNLPVSDPFERQHPYHCRLIGKVAEDGFGCWSYAIGYPEDEVNEDFSRWERIDFLVVGLKWYTIDPERIWSVGHCEAWE